MKIISKLLIPLIVCFLISCEEDTGDNGNFSYDKETLLTDVADNYIIPNYVTFNNSFSAFVIDFKAYKESKSDSDFNSAKSSFTQLQKDWQRVAFLGFGPAADERLLEELNIYPVSTDQISANLSSVANTNLGSASNNAAKGLPAIEYLLFADGKTDLTQDEIDYILLIIDRVSPRIQAVNSAWSGNYRDEFIQNTENGATSSLSIMFNGVMLYFERHLRDEKLAIPLGIRSSGNPNPTWVENYYSGNSWDNLVLAFDQYVEFHEIGEKYGLVDLIRESGAEYQGEKVDVLITNSFNATKLLLQNTPNDYQQSLANSDEYLVDIFKEMQVYVTLMKVPVPQALGIQITYNDTDGD